MRACECLEKPGEVVLNLFIIKKKISWKEAGNMVEHFPSMHRVLNSSPSISWEKRV